MSSSPTGKMTMEQRRKMAKKLGITVNQLYHLQQDRELEKALEECHPKVLPRKKKARAVLLKGSLYLSPGKNHEKKLMSLLLGSKCEPRVKVVPKLSSSVADSEKPYGHYPYNFGDTRIGPIYKGSDEELNTTMNTF